MVTVVMMIMTNMTVTQCSVVVIIMVASGDYVTAILRQL
jgi:hypothetical protein